VPRGWGDVYGSAVQPAAIVPRWEWRTFADRFGEADRQLDALEAGLVQDSDEL